MESIERITQDLRIFEENIVEVDQLDLDDAQKQVSDMAKRYYEDTKYYSKINDELTAFACIAYAHGLLDSLRIMNNLIKDD